MLLYNLFTSIFQHLKKNTSHLKHKLTCTWLLRVLCFQLSNVNYFTPHLNINWNRRTASSFFPFFQREERQSNLRMFEFRNLQDISPFWWWLCNFCLKNRHPLFSVYGNTLSWFLNFLACPLHVMYACQLQKYHYIFKKSCWKFTKEKGKRSLKKKEANQQDS